MRFLAGVLASGLGSGFSPVAPGTAGSLLAAGLIYLSAGWWGPATALVATAALYFAGVWACNVSEKMWGHDDGRMVIDEVAGMSLSAAWIEASSLPWLAGAFILFRLFDIIKPFPANRAEHLPGGWGVMTDDIVAGAYALLAILGLKLWM